MYPMPQWKDENPVTYAKQQLSVKIKKLINERHLAGNERIKEIDEELILLRKDRESLNKA